MNLPLESLKVGWLGGPHSRYWLTRFVLLRAIGFIYCVAFLVLCNQWPGLIGSHGLLPVARFIPRIRDDLSFLELPTLFWSDTSDAALGLFAWLGLLVAICVLLGAENAVLMFVLWAVYMSFSHVGQIFWGYGWEILLLETGFLAIFLCPLTSVRPLRSTVAPSPIVIFLLRWLAFRLMFGAGLIKIRGDECWRDLTCLLHHYETQPLPGPLSALFHHAPAWFHKAGVVVNHFAELVAPFGALGPRYARYAAGLVIVAFQLTLIASGNLSFLNWLTIAVALSCFDDAAFGRLLPASLRARADALEASRTRSRAQIAVASVLALVVALLSLDPIENMLSPRQRMNTSFDPLHLVNSYGAFGSVGEVRREIILSGTRDEALGPQTRWLEYELPCKPGELRRRPCLVTPYYYRLDWQLWFAAMSRPEREPWFLHLVYKLLRGEPAVRELLGHDPFGDEPPRHIRAELYEYRFAPLGAPEHWQRTYLHPYIEPVSLQHAALLRYLRSYGFVADDEP